MASDIASSLRVWPVGGGETGALIRTRDWSATPLGNIGQWPERLRAAVDSCLDAAFASFVWWGPDLVQLYNDQALAIVQANHPAVFGVPAREAWPDVWAAIGPVVERVMRTGRPVSGGNMLLAPHRVGRHEPACISFSYSALRDSVGAVAGMLVTACEMTEGVRAEPAQGDRTLEATDEGYLLVDVIFDEAGRAVDIEYVEANPAAMRMVGDDMTGRRVSESGVDYEPYWYEVWGRVARTGKGERVERYAAPLKRWFVFFVFKPAPSNHESRRVAVVFQDVTERRNAEIAERARAAAALQESAEQFRQFGDASSDVLWIRDGNTLQWEYLSPAFETIYGEPREDVLKGDNLASWVDLIVSEDRQRALANIGRVRSGEHVTFEYRIQRPSDGEIRWLRNTDFPLVDETGRVRRIGGISHDVTGEKAAAERVVAMVGELQHRTRNLIAVVRSIISHTLASSPSPDGFKRRIDDRLSALSRVQGLLSRSGQEPVTIGALVRLELGVFANTGLMQLSR